MTTSSSRWAAKDARSLDGNSVILILQDAFNPKEFLAVDHHAAFLIKVRIHNHVRNPCLIFQTQKDEALRCPRTLPSDYASGHLRVLPVRHPRQIARSLHLQLDRKSTRLNSSHSSISYAVFCLKKKKI